MTEKGKTAARIIEEKEKRVMDAIRMKIPDRVPVICSMNYFPARYVGIPFSAAYYDYDAWYKAYKRTLKDFINADFVFSQGFSSGKALEILNPRNMRWPGYGVDPYHGHQSIEVDFMKEGDYDHYLEDPSDYMFRILLSRSSEHLAGLAMLPKLSDISGSMGAQMMAMVLTMPEVSHAIETLQKVGRESRKWQKRIAEFDRMMVDMGFPRYFQGAAMPPFDMISHSMRGMQGTMTDMFRQPDKLLAACEKILEQTMKRPLPPPNEFGNRRIFMTNTRGSDNFLSTPQFDKFYWPTFRKLVHWLVEQGTTPCIFFEGDFTSRLEYLLDFPKGSILVRLDSSDIYKAKKVLKDHLCIQGNVPSTLLQSGTVQEVKDYCKDLIDVIGKDGGFILSNRSSTDEVNPENLKAMVDFTREYGVYR